MDGSSSSVLGSWVLGLCFFNEGIQAPLRIGVVEVVNKGRFLQQHVLTQGGPSSLVQELFDAAHGVGRFLVDAFT